MNTKFIVASFLPIYPITFGSSVVISSFFENIPFRKKILFQISTKKKFNKKYIKNTFCFNENKLTKFFFVLKHIINILYEIKKTNEKKILIVEGASWIGYSFILILLIKLFFSKVKIFYRGHSIEYEIRKKNNNFIIAELSYFFEKFVYTYSDICSSVSDIEKKKIKQLYNVTTQIFPNIINYKFRKLKIKKKKYIFYSGSYKYLPNKYAIDRLVKNIIPKIKKKIPNIELVITGSDNIPYKHSWLKNLGLVTKNKYFKILRQASCLVVPTQEGYGTRVKIIEALCEGVVVVSSQTGIEGIRFNKKSPPPFICSNDISFAKTIIKVIKFKKYNLKAFKNRTIFIEAYDAKKNTNIFINKYLCN
jgi:glycosyltransferase involved in cell wall biosynthesis